MPDRRPETQRHRARQLVLRKKAIDDLGKLWPALQWDDLDGSYPDFAIRVGAMVRRNRATSIGLASDYVQALQRMSGRTGFPTVFPAALDVAQVAASLRVTSLVSLKKAAARGSDETAALASARRGAANAMSRLVLNGGRETVIATARTSGARFQRILGGGGCDFCTMLADCGAVYYAETADFESHDRCGCTVEPEWD